MNLTGHRRTPVWGFVAQKNTVHPFLQIWLSEGVWRSVLSCLFLMGSFRQSQPGVQGRGGNRDIGPERQRPRTGQAVHHGHVRLFLCGSGQYAAFVALSLHVWKQLSSFSTGNHFCLYNNGTIPVRTHSDF